MNKDEFIFDLFFGIFVEFRMGDCKIVKLKFWVIKVNKDVWVFIILIYIIVGYFVCWVLFYVVYDVIVICLDLVLDLMYLVVFWLMYFNFMLNLFLYNFSSLEFWIVF